MVHRKPTKFSIFLVVLLILCCILLYWYANDNETHSTAILVLGGGLTSSGQVPLHTQLRLEKAVSLLKKYPGSVIITLSGGTPHKPNPLDLNGFPIWESSAAAKKLVEMGVSAENVFEENFSLDTVGNAYFVRAVHIDPGKYSNIFIITNNWHIERTKAIFDHVFSLPADKLGIFHTLTYWLRKPHYRLHYKAVEAGIEDNILLASRIAREKKSRAQFEHGTKHEFSTMKEMHDWVFLKHSAYTTARHAQKAEVLDKEVLKSY